MGFNSAFKRVKIVKNPGNGRLNNLNDPVLNVLKLKTENFRKKMCSGIKICRQIDS